ncbi:MAG: bifunctional DNA primase/polymerase [Betaproteobacteria bacterium]|nr:bifunctional DNA primase/polymerase [Betaproteobacteria bacterium]
MSDNISTAEFALRYARAGFRVLPCNAKTKAPLSEHGAKDATTDEETIRQWFGRWPQAGLGMALDGHVVVDVDVRDGKQGEETLETLKSQNGQLPDGPTQRTRSGGFHYLFRARAGASYPGAAGADVDLKHGPHSYICVEPTAGYAWLDEGEPWRDDVVIPEAPQWLERSSRSEAPPSGAGMPAKGKILSAHEIERTRAMLAYAGNVDSYEPWLRAGMALHHGTGGSEQGFELWTAWAKKSAKFDYDTHRKKWESFGNSGQGVTLASLAYIARGNGWHEESAHIWGDLSLPGAIKTPTISADILPGLLGEMAAAVARSTQTPEAASVMCALAVLAAPIQRRYEVSPFGDEYRETLSLWTLVALPSGARKTAIIGALAAPLHHFEKLERDRLRSEIARTTSQRLVAKKRIESLTQQAAKAENAQEREKLRQAIEDEELAMPDERRAPRLITGDVTPERLQALIAEHGERMTVLSDEPGIFQVLAGQYSGGMANIDAFLQSHSGAPFRVDRAGREAHVDRPALSFGLMIQPGILAELAGVKRFRDSGLLARFLFVLPENLVGTRDVRARSGIPEKLRADWEALVFSLLPRDASPTPGKPTVLGLSEGARECWLTFAEKVERNQGDGGRFESIADWSAKLPGAAARIATILELALSHGAAREVGVDCMWRGVRLASLLIPHAEAAFRLLGADAIEDDARALLRWIQANHLLQFKRSEAQKALEGRFRTVKRLEDAAARLAEWNALSPVRMYRNAGARPTPLYYVNPALFDERGSR